MNTQMLKGILEGCIIHLIGLEESYGYRVVEDLNRFGFDVNEATVYPILKRLENRGLLEVEKKPSPWGPMRKYYRLSSQGEQEAGQFRQSWLKTRDMVDQILRREGQ